MGYWSDLAMQYARQMGDPYEYSDEIKDPQGDRWNEYMLGRAGAAPGEDPAVSTRQYGEDAKTVLAGLPPAALTIGSSVAADVAAGPTGMMMGSLPEEKRPQGLYINGEWKPSLMGDQPMPAAAAVEQVQNALTIQPKGEAGKRVLSGIGNALSTVVEPATRGADYFLQEGTDAGIRPSYLAAPLAALTAGLEIAGPRGARGAERSTRFVKLAENYADEAIKLGPFAHDPLMGARGSLLRDKPDADLSNVRQDMQGPAMWQTAVPENEVPPIARLRQLDKRHAEINKEISGLNLSGDVGKKGIDEAARLANLPTPTGPQADRFDVLMDELRDINRQKSKLMDANPEIMSPLGQTGVGRYQSGSVKDTGAGKQVLATQASRNVVTNALNADDYAFTPSDFDIRYDPRVKEFERLNSLRVGREQVTPPPGRVALQDLEGMPFVTSMSDRTAARHNLNAINDVELAGPVRLRGGQDYMFENPGQVWASGVAPANNILNEARRVKAATGQDPLYLPWRMAPTGGDFSTMTGETMLAYASANMGKGNKRSLNARLKKIIPDWPGVDDPKAIDAFTRATDKQRKQAKQVMDVEFRDRGGLSIGEARLAVSDPDQIGKRDLGAQNVGRIHADKDILPSDHPSYPAGVPGEGVGRLDADIGVLELLPDFVEQRGITNALNHRVTDMRAMQMGAKSGVITEGILRKLADRGVNVAGLSTAAIIALAIEQGLIKKEDVENET